MSQLFNILTSSSPLIAIESPLIDWDWAIAAVKEAAKALELPLYYYAPNFKCLQIIDAEGMRPEGTALGADLWSELIETDKPGLFLIEGVEFNDNRSIYALARAFRALGSNRKWILLDSSFSIPPKLESLFATCALALPDRSQIAKLLESSDSRAISSCLGLSYGEIQLVKNRAMDIATEANAYKVSKLKGKGIETISEPDVPVGGLDLLNEWMQRASMLLQERAKEYNLSFPKGAILWGVPGTGKSLSAKHAAKTMGVPLVAADWSGLISAVPGESESNLRYLLQLTELIAPCILYFDDFEKGFAGWDAKEGGDIQKRLAGKLLTWMQERTAPILVLATVNRLGNLPPELIRRFEEVFFVDLPSNKEIYQIFNVHLAKYFPNFEFTKTEWVQLIRAYKSCTAAEIAVWTKKTAESLYCQGRPGQVTLADLLESRKLFVPSCVRESEQILAIRNKAIYARAASSPDSSEWSVPPQKLFERAVKS